MAKLERDGLRIEDVEIRESDTDTSDLDITKQEFDKQKENSEEDSREDVTPEQTSLSTKYILIGLAAIVLIIILVFNIGGYITPSPVNKQTGSLVGIDQPALTTETAENYVYNGIQFTKKGEFWHAPLRTGNTIYNTQFYYGPREIENIEVEGNPIFHTLFQEDELYITFNPLDENLTFVALAVGQLNTHMIRTFKKTLIAACDRKETDACQDRPIVNCENTNSTAVFYLKESDTPKVTFNNNCVMIEGRGWDIVKSAENVLMRAYAILK